MNANQKAAVTDVSQQKVSELQSELNVIEKKVNNNQSLSEDDIKFVSQLGWISAAAVLVTSLAAGV
ncbi:MAG: hypothetical protein WCA64_13150 [Gallionella sp.]